MRIVMSQGGYQGFRRISRQEASSALLALASMATWRNHKALRNVSFKPLPYPIEPIDAKGLPGDLRASLQDEVRHNPSHQRSE